VDKCSLLLNFFNLKKRIKVLGYQFYLNELLIIFLSYLMMENIFSWLVLPNSVILLAFEKITSLIIFAYVLYNFTDLKRNEKIYVGLFTFFVLKLILESFFKYGVLFQQLTLFTILFPVIYVIYIKAVCRSLELDFLEFIAKFYLITYVVIMLIYGRGFAFSLESVDMDDYGPFSGDSRIIHARSILMIIIPLLWYLDQYLQFHKTKHLMLFAFCLVIIIVHQHRSVWASTIFAMLIFTGAYIRNKFLSLPRFINIMVVSLIFIIITGVVLINFTPKYVDFFSDRFSEILNPTREGGTGEFREQQREVYFKFFLKKPIFGWTFEGFNMPNPLVDWWPAKSGQHFHEGYMEMLFYHGITGLLLKYWFLIYLSIKAFSKTLSRESIILIAFSCSGLVFSFSYVLPLIFWGHVGLCLYYLEKNEDEEIEDHPVTYYEANIDDLSYLNTIEQNH
jgi:hypothetical protein